jgi:hypothetical protein
MATDAQIRGFATELGLGVDFFLGDFVSIGVGCDAAVVKLSRSELDLDPVRGVELREDGDAAGLLIRPTIHLGLHF